MVSSMTQRRNATTKPRRPRPGLARSSGSINTPGRRPNLFAAWSFERLMPTVKAMLHITDGESVAGTLRESALTGVVSTYGDLMFEGPAPAGLDAEAWRDVRARFIADSDYAALEEARQYLQGCENTLAAFSQHEEVLIWLDHRLSNQLILIKVLDWFGRQELGGVQVSLVRVEQ